MAKRKGRGKSRKRTKKSSSFLSTVKKMFIGAFFVVLCFIGLLFIYNYFYPVAGKQSGEHVQKEKKEQAVQKAERTKVAPKTSEKKAVQSKSPVSGTTKTFKVPANAEIPELTVKRKEQVIKHEGYTVSYNSDYCIANWVAYELTAQEAKSKKNARSNKFVPDPMVKGATATNEDYTRTGYDRGHLAPAGDMKWSAKAMRESFYFSNICPQSPGLNRGIWKDLEEQSRLWAIDYSPSCMVTGPVSSDDMKRLGKNRVGIPKSFYKVLCYYSNGKYKGAGFLFDNKDYKNTSLKKMVIPIDSVEKVTGINFFPSLPSELEKEMEATVDLNAWSF